MNRKKLTLAILLILLFFAILYSVLSQPKVKRAGSLKFQGKGAAGSVSNSKAFINASSAQIDDTKLHLSILDRELSPFSGVRRNIFSPIFHEDAKPESKSSSGRINLPVPPPPPMIPSFPPVPPASQIPETTPLQRDMARFTFLGFLKKDDKKTIFLSSDKEIFLVKKGDTIAGKYEVANLTEDALTIHPLGDGGEIIIPLVENRALAAPKR